MPLHQTLATAVGSTEAIIIRSELIIINSTKQLVIQNWAFSTHAFAIGLEYSHPELKSS